MHPSNRRSNITLIIVFQDVGGKKDLTARSHGEDLNEIR